MKIPTDCAENLAVTMCGGRLKPHVVDGGCDTIRFEGIEDATVNQGVGIDLRDGITAYDGDGNEIEYEVEPSELAPCEVGEFDVEYRAVGKGLSMKPTVCGRNKIHAIDCGLDTVVEHRLITVTQADPPTISGVGETVIGENTDFDPLGGVSAVDDNGNVLEVEYSGKYLQEANGGIASFESEYEDPLHSLKVSLEPIQDLHGYDKPWVGGAGKNVLPFVQNGGSSLGITLTYDAEEEAYILNGTASSTGNITLATVPNIAWDTSETYSISATKVSGSMTIGSGSGITFAVSLFKSDNSAYIRGGNLQMTDIDGYAGYGASFDATNAKLYFQLWREGTVFNNLKFKVQVEKGNTATSWTPYSNICPISGWTEVNTHRTGVNVWDEEWEVGAYNGANGNKVSVSNRIRCKNRISVLPNTQYYFKATGNVSLYYYGADGTYIRQQWQSNRGVFTTSDGCYYITFNLGVNAGETYNNDISINYPSTDTDYHAYEGDTYTTSLGQTVYGGTLDVVSGELVVDRKLIDMGGLNWAYQSSTQRFIIDITDAKRPPSNFVKANIVCSIYETLPSGDTESSGNDGSIGMSQWGTVGVRDTAKGTSASDFKTAMQGAQLCYELATPQTIQLTPQEVRTLLGQNNVWSDGIYHPLVKRYLKDNSWVGRYINGVMYYVNNGYGYLHTDTFKDAFVDCSHFAVKKFVSKPTDTSTPLADNALYLTDDGSLYVRYDAIEDEDPTVSLQNWIDFVTDNNVFMTVPSYSDTASDSLDLTLQYNAPIPQGEAYQYIAQGTYTVTYRAVDQCGNETEVTRNITVGENIPVRRTVLRQDGTLVINELASEYYANNEIYGAIVKEFEPYDENNRYIFTLNNLPPWYADKNSITNVAVGEHIYPTQLDLWFYGLSNAETWELARLHTENATSMHRMFASAQVENLHLDQLDTSSVTDFSYMFNGAISTQPVIPSLMDTSKGENFGSMFESANFDMIDTVGMDVSNALIMASMFANCSNLTELDLSTFIPLKCTDFGRMFFGCFRLQHLNLLNFHTPSAVLMNNMFGSCYGLQELDLSAFDTSNVTNMTGMFLMAATASPIDLTGFDTHNVERFQAMFAQCNITGSAQYLDLSTWDTSSATTMESMFAQTHADVINIANFTTPNVGRFTYMFGSDTTVTTIYCNNDFDTSSMTNDGGMFENMPRLVGGNGTAWSSSHIKSDYARLDNPPSAPGYFTIAPDSDITNEEGIELTNEDDETITT